jgi:hypothetical protein
MHVLNFFKDKFNSLGQLMPDQRPLEASVTHVPPMSLAEQMRQHMAVIEAEAVRRGGETFEEANDFDVYEDVDGEPYGSKYDLGLEHPDHLQMAGLQAFIDAGGDPQTSIDDYLRIYKQAEPDAPVIPPKGSAPTEPLEEEDVPPPPKPKK